MHTSLPLQPPTESAAVVAQMRPALVKYFRRKCGTNEEAEDLAQEVLARALSHVDWNSPEHAKGYIFRAAVNLWRDKRRQDGRRGASVEWTEATELQALPAFVDEGSTPENVLMNEQALDCVVREVSRMTTRMRDILFLTRLEQMKQPAVAQLLGVSLSTVEKDLVKALAQLARCAKETDGTP